MGFIGSGWTWVGVSIPACMPRASPSAGAAGAADGSSTAMSGILSDCPIFSFDGSMPLYSASLVASERRL